MLGLTPEDFDGDQTEIWPEHKQAFDLWKKVRTQWRVRESGAIGLDYNVALHLMDRMHLDDEQYNDLLADLQTMELAIIDIVNRRPSQ